MAAFLSVRRIAPGITARPESRPPGTVAVGSVR